MTLTLVCDCLASLQVITFLACSGSEVEQCIIGKGRENEP